MIFASPTRDTLWKHGTAISPTSAVNTTTNAHLDAAKTALRQYMRAGGGFVGIHNAFGTEYNWPYYEGLLGNANYYDHGANQDGTVVVVAKDSSTAGLPAALAVQGRVVQPAAVPDQGEVPSHRRRGHAGVRSARRIRVTANSIRWRGASTTTAAGSWVTTLGHDGAAFTEGSGFPGQAQFQKLIVQRHPVGDGQHGVLHHDHRQHDHGR